MKKLLPVLLLCMSSTLFGFVPTAQTLKNVKNVDLFISFQRSGQSWTLEGLQFMTRRIWVHFEDYPSNVNRHVWQNLFNIDLDLERRPIYQSHRFEHVKYMNRQGNNRVFMIMRNYREVLLRHLKQNPQGEIDRGQMLQQLPDIAMRFAQILEAYDEYPEHLKCMVTYEDLMKRPRNVFKTLLTFLHEPDDRLDLFMDDYDGYKAVMFKAYNKVHAPDGGSTSRGKSLTFHQSQVSTSLIRLLDMIMKQAVSRDIWEKYLEPYCTEVSR